MVDATSNLPSLETKLAKAATVPTTTTSSPPSSTPTTNLANDEANFVTETNRQESERDSLEDEQTNEDDRSSRVALDATANTDDVIDDNYVNTDNSSNINRTNDSSGNEASCIDDLKENKQDLKMHVIDDDENEFNDQG